MLYFLIFPALRTEASAPSDGYVPEISAVISSVSLPPPTTPAFIPVSQTPITNYFQQIIDANSSSLISP
jgi:hypothetical protein